MIDSAEPVYPATSFVWLLSSSDAPVMSPTSGVLKLHAVDHRFGLPTVLCGENGKMAFEDLCHIRAQKLLPPRANGLDKGPHQAEITTAVTTAFVGRSMNGCLTSAKVRHSERGHVTDDLAVGEMQTSLSLTKQFGVGDHRKRYGCA
jgi:hypothetical protein